MERLWTKPFIQLTAGMLFLFTGFYLLLPTMPLFIKQLGGSESQVGFVVGVFTLSAVIFRPIVGGLLDRYGRRSFIIWGLLLFVVAMYLYSWVGGIVVLLVLRIVVHGMSWALSTTAVGTAITDVIPPARRGEGMGWYGLAMTVAMAIGPMLGIWMLQKLSFHGLFLYATGFAAVALLLALGTKIPFQLKAGAGRIQLVEKSVLSVTVAIFFLAVSYGGITTFLPLFAESIKVNPGTFFLVYAVALTLIRPIAGKLSDRYGGRIVRDWIRFRTACTASGHAASCACGPQRVANASFFTAFDLGIGLGAIALGWVSQHTGYQALFTVSAVSVAVSLILFAVFVRQLLRAAVPQN